MDLCDSGGLLDAVNQDLLPFSSLLCGPQELRGREGTLTSGRPNGLAGLETAVLESAGSLALSTALRPVLLSPST